MLAPATPYLFCFFSLVPFLSFSVSHHPCITPSRKQNAEVAAVSAREAAEALRLDVESRDTCIQELRMEIEHLRANTAEMDGKVAATEGLVGKLRKQMAEMRSQPTDESRANAAAKLAEARRRIQHLLAEQTEATARAREVELVHMDAMEQKSKELNEFRAENRILHADVSKLMVVIDVRNRTGVLGCVFVGGRRPLHPPPSPPNFPRLPFCLFLCRLIMPGLFTHCCFCCCCYCCCCCRCCCLGVGYS